MEAIIEEIYAILTIKIIFWETGYYGIFGHPLWTFWIFALLYLDM